MGIAPIGIVVSALTTFLLVLLFKKEASEGRRVGAPLRRRFDFLVIKLEYHIGRLLGFIGSDVSRQVVHYCFHAFLLRTSRILVYVEQKIERLLRSNRMLARKARRERSTRTVLDQIVEHRKATAFTDEERQRHKDEALHRW